jgi:tripartite-type tricarboxylate transporter receptor subunit TctC
VRRRPRRPTQAAPHGSGLRPTPPRRWRPGAVEGRFTTWTADADASFYDGKTITYIVGTKPGGGYDTYARLIAKHMERHLPGAQILVENVPGAGHIIAANRLFASKPDGLTIGTFNTGLIYAQLLGLEGVRFDLRDYSWIGHAASDPRVLVVGSESGIRSLEDLRTASTPVLFGTTGAGSASHNDTALLAAVLDLNLKLIPGYSGQEIQLAILRGELQGLVGSFSSVSDFVDNGYGRIITRIGGDRVPALAGIPEAADLVADAGAKGGIIDVIRANAEIGRLTAAPPETPDDLLQPLILAYRGALEDPALLEEAAKLDRPIDPAYGREVARQIEAALELPAAVVEELKLAIGCGGEAEACEIAD